MYTVYTVNIKCFCDCEVRAVYIYIYIYIYVYIYIYIYGARRIEAGHVFKYTLSWFISMLTVRALASLLSHKQDGVVPTVDATEELVARAARGAAQVRHAADHAVLAQSETAQPQQPSQLLPTAAGGGRACVCDLCAPCVCDACAMCVPDAQILVLRFAYHAPEPQEAERRLVPVQRAHVDPDAARCE